MWYTLDGGLINITFIANGTIDQIEWDARANGTVTITFYANDTLGNLASNSVVVRKDIQPPSVSIISPLPNELFGFLAPTFNVEITEGNADTFWYTLDGGLTNFTFITNGTIDQTEWDKYANGTVTIIFYANDTLGNFASNSVVVRKDIELPNIIINAPLPNELFGFLAPTFSVEITDINGINTMWYTLDGGLTNITFIANGTIDQTEWDDQGNGTVTITFYANDNVGNIAFNSVVVRKDIEGPNIIIISPLPNGLFGTLAPTFNVEITDINGVDTMWYTLDGGLINITFIANVTIDQTEWDARASGAVTIIFYGNDTLGNLASDSVVVRKDLELPDINIISPLTYELFGVNVPNYIVVISDDNLDTMWYTLDGGLTNITFIANGTIDQTEWNARANGTVTIIFYANDTLGNLASNSVVVRKDLELPNIIINSPLPNELFGVIAPTFNVEITDINGVDTMWYTLDGGLINITFIDNGTINQIEWDARTNGTVTITFYANDIVGNLASDSVVVRKDLELPDININSPLPNEIYGGIAPTFNVEITDINGIDTMWYTLDGGLINITFIVNGTIDQIEWDNQGNGTITIIFYANDTLGNLASNSVIVRKDIEGPNIIIISPLPNELYGALAPTFNVEITDINGVDTMWYTLDGGLINITFIANGTIDQIEWDARANGTVTITFYANDTLGNLALNSIVVRKDIELPNIIINSPLPNVLFGKNSPSVSLDVQDANLDEVWYQLSNGTVTTNNYTWTGFIDQVVWDQVGNGTVTIRFYANDTVGNIASNSVFVRKDIELPNINIISPLPNELFGALAPTFTVEISDVNGVDMMWYSLDGGFTNITFITNDTIDQIEWDAQANGMVTITFYANDTLGNLASNSVVVQKDIEPPSINIISPLPNELFGSFAPSFTMEIDASNGIDTMWYSLDGGLTNFTFITNGTINQAAWDNQVVDTVTITFYANDTLGTLASDSVIVRKDIIAPNITIFSPLLNESFGNIAPTFNVEISDINGVDMMWYFLDGGLTNITFIANGTIDQIEWDAQANGMITITFYANDTVGNLASNSIVVRKDIELPDININSPLPNELYGGIAPTFNVEITDFNGVDTMWYTLDGGLTNITFINNGTFDQTEWDTQGNGTVTIIFYANDTLGNLASNSVVVRKDIELPDINIISPLPNELFGSLTPTFNVEITDINGIDTMWYSLDGGLTNITFIVNSSIDQIEWGAQLNGTVSITFFANDTLGNLAFNSVVVRKDIEIPNINIISPLPNELFGALAPTFTLEITDINGVDTMWYTLDGGLTNITFIANGTIDQTEWDAQGNGTVTITFYANDNVGNLASDSVVVRKNVEGPNINIISPLPNELFGSLAPTFTVEIATTNSIDIMWYTLNGGITNITFITNGTIDQIEWDAQTSGTITLIFYANDTLGNLASSSVVVRKDIEIPNINIISPLPSELFGVNAPNYIVVISDDNLDTMWYTLDGGLTNITFIANGTIDQTEWDNYADGTVTIIFYANDTIGNLASNSVVVEKDIIVPVISINSPLSNELFGSLAPTFNVEITDINGIDTMWYTLDGGSTNITFIANGTIDQTEWNARANGTVTIIFYAIDTVGNLASNSVIVRKDIEVSNINIISPLLNEIFGSLAPNFIIELTDINGIDAMWYTLDGGSTNITFITNGTIDQMEWDNQANGTVTIIFYAIDTVGNLASNSVVVRKDIELPIININSPLTNELFGSLAPTFDVEITDINGIDTMWYTLDGGLTNITFIASGTIDQTEWDDQVNGTVTITFYATDTIGNLASNSVVVRKDIEVPNINIISPLPDELFGFIAPNFTVEISDINGIDTMWYSIDGGLTNITFITNDTIDQIEWDNQGNGTVTITFYATDTVGNLASNSAIVRKDILSGPTILINTPSSNSLFGYTPPNYIIEITSINVIDIMWYTLDGGITNITLIANGTIDQTEWDSQANGIVTIIFYANDTLGNLASNSVVVRKDIEIPNINIISPLPNELFGALPPTFNLEITDINGIDAMWYSLDGGLTNTTFITNDTIDQVEWNNQANGTVTIIFYANDTVGNLASNSVVVRKDIAIPIISINSPLSNEFFGSLAPNFHVIITAINDIDTMWYTLDDGLTNTIFLANGTINQAAWDVQGNGTITITFFANDTLGNQGSNLIVVRKDILSGPTMLMNSPIMNSIFGYNTPNFNVEITNINGIDTMWYTLDGGLTNITFMANNSIDQTEWGTLGNGTVTIRFYANNTLGTISFTDITVRKDIEMPVISVHHPLVNETFQRSSPEFNLSIIEGNLDLTWYFLSSDTFETDNITFSGLTGKIDQGLWDNFGSGSVEIVFYATDIVGNIGSQTVSITRLPVHYILETTIIDDSGAGDYTWDQAQAQEWCFGSGTWNDPYIIEFILIDGQNSGSNLIIRNSNAIFILRHSVLHNSGGGAYDAGLKLEHVSNAILINLDCSHNNGNGVYLYYCKNITIKESIIKHNKLAGIFLNRSWSNFILNNTETISYNYWGISLFLSNGNSISGNLLKNNQFGLFSKKSNGNLINNNFFIFNDEAYVEEDSYGNRFQENTVVPKPVYLFLTILSALGIVSISSVSFVVIQKRVIIPKKIKDKLHQRLLAVDILIKEKNLNEAYKNLENVKDLSVEYGLFDIFEESNEKIAQCNSKLNIFLSYSTLDTNRFQILRIVKSLEEYPEIAKVMCWEAEKALFISTIKRYYKKSTKKRRGKKISDYLELINETLKKYDVFVLFCSENSVKSASIKDEWQVAFDKRKISIIPVYEKKDNIPDILERSANVKFDKRKFKNFIKKLYQEILHSKALKAADDEHLYEIYKEKKGKKALYRGKETKSFKEWKRQVLG